MGEIADDMIEGRSCSLCGQYFMDKKGNIFEHGYPVVCDECWEEEDKDDIPSGYQRQSKKCKTL
jgi:hypothetical protein